MTEEAVNETEEFKYRHESLGIVSQRAVDELKRIPNSKGENSDWKDQL